MPSDQALQTIADSLRTVFEELEELRNTTEKIMAQQKTLMERLGVPTKFERRVRAATKEAKRTLRRNSFDLSLRPLKDVRPLTGPDFNWESTGSDPSFQLMPQGERYPTGWVQLVLDIASASGAPVVARMYVDQGQGYLETDVLALPATKNGQLKAVIKLHDSVAGIRFDPFEGPGKFKVGKVQMVELSKAETAARIALPALNAAAQSPQEILPTLVSYAQAFQSGGVRAIKERLAELADGRVSSSPVTLNYQHWIFRYDTLTDLDRQAIGKRLGELPAPLISILISSQDNSGSMLRKAVASVRSQLYPNWELIIDAAAVPPDLGRLDERIRFAPFETASGQWLTTLGAEDELSEQALYYALEEIAAQPSAALIYSDEDKIDLNGRRTDPHFKSSWNQGLFYSSDLMDRFCLIRSDLAKEVGGLRSEFKSGQTFDLALRVAEKISSDQIRHLPAVLYHQRSFPGAKPLASILEKSGHSSGVRALDEHFKRTKVNATVETGLHGERRVRYALPEKRPLVSIIMPTRNGLSLLRRCVESIVEKTDYPEYELIVVDNQSDDPETLAYFKDLEARGFKVVPYDHPFNYSAINNFAAKHAKGSLIGLLNNDLEVIKPNWLSEMVSLVLQPDVGTVGAKLYYPNGEIQHGGVILGLGGLADHALKYLPGQEVGPHQSAVLLRDYSAVTAACLLVRKEVFDQVGGLNETLKVAFNDVDFCLQVGKLGLRNVWTPYAELYHHESATRGPDDTEKKKARFRSEINYMLEHWPEVIANDPFYNPNLTLNGHDFGLAWPPRVQKPWIHSSSSKPKSESNGTRKAS